MTLGSVTLAHMVSLLVYELCREYLFVRDGILSIADYNSSQIGVVVILLVVVTVVVVVVVVIVVVYFFVMG